LKLKAGDDMLFDIIDSTISVKKKGGKIGKGSSERKLDIGCMLG
jgi:hypothetical protein